MDGNRAGYADGISQLDFAFVSQAGSDDVLGDVTSCIGSRTVDFCGVLAGESTAAMTSHAAIGIDDDLAAREA